MTTKLSVSSRKMNLHINTEKQRFVMCNNDGTDNSGDVEIGKVYESYYLESMVRSVN